MSDDKVDIYIDRVFISRYLVKQKLGVGAFARVYLVQDEYVKSEYFVIFK